MSIKAQYVQTFFTVNALRYAQDPIAMSVATTALAYKYKPLIDSPLFLESLEFEFTHLYGTEYQVQLYSLSEEQIVDKLVDYEQFSLLVSLRNDDKSIGVTH